MAKPVFRTITSEWLVSRFACDPGLALWDQMVPNGKALLQFKGNQYDWVINNLDYEILISWDTVKDYAISASEVNEFVHWLFQEVAQNSSELLKDLSTNGVDLDDECFTINEGVKIPEGYSAGEFAYRRHHNNSIRFAYLIKNDD